MNTIAKPIPAIPTFVVTGFLGSGKTTLLRHLLNDPAFSKTVVIVNEFGEVGLDHELIAFSSERTIVMPGGCICCSIREDIETTLRDLFAQVDSGALSSIDRLVIETTGLADPVPLLFTLYSSPHAAARLVIHSVITTIDAILGAETLDRHLESEKQVAVADQVVVTKCDLVRESDVTALIAALRRRNPWAAIQRRNLTSSPPLDLFGGNRQAPGRDGAKARDWVLGNVDAENVKNGIQPADNGKLHADAHGNGTGSGGDPRNRRRRMRNAHRHAIHSFSVTYDHATDWTAFGIWLTLCLHRYGPNILRIKGMLAVDGMPGPVVIHAVQHVVHEPVHLDEWPSGDHRSRLVFIVHGLDAGLVERSVRAFTRPAPEAAMTERYRPAGAGGTIGGRPVRRATAPRWVRG